MNGPAPSHRQHEPTQIGQGHGDDELQLPEGWMVHTSRGGEVFFHHFDTGKTSVSWF